MRQIVAIRCRRFLNFIGSVRSSPLSSLTVVATADRQLTTAQRKFNQLVQKIERARADLSAWDEHAPLFAQAAELEALHDAYAEVDFAADKAQDMAR